MSQCIHETIFSNLIQLELDGNGKLSPLQQKLVNIVQAVYLKENVPKVRGILAINKAAGDKRSGMESQVGKLIEAYKEMDEKIPNISCTECSKSIRCKTMICLECDQAYCTQHSSMHAKKKGHYLGVKVKGISITCMCCKVLLLHENTKLLKNTAISELKQKLKGGECESILDTIIKHIKERKLLKECFEINKCLPLRGIKNLGNTCFMNAIFQMLAHNPTISNVYLAMNRTECAGEGCMSCLIQKFIKQYYSKETSPMVLTALLESMWSSAKHLAGYAQQDAHEFFIALINKIHEDEINYHNAVTSTTAEPCKCLVHKAFGGELQSSVTCLTCNKVSNKGDPYLDNALDIRIPKKRRVYDIPDNKEKKNTIPELELKECLRGFIQTETLSADSYRCSNCKNQTEATKQMMFKTLAPVLSFQLKRYSHDPSSLSKLNTKIHLPLKLDMTPYVANDNKPLSKGGFFSSPKEIQQNSNLFNYKLFGVVHHIGTLDNGHYISYILHKGQWIEFDDHIVRQVSEEEVINNRAYLCYYLAEPKPLPY